MKLNRVVPNGTLRGVRGTKTIHERHMRKKRIRPADSVRSEKCSVSARCAWSWEMRAASSIPCGDVLDEDGNLLQAAERTGVDGTTVSIAAQWIDGFFIIFCNAERCSKEISSMRRIVYANT